MNRKRILIPVVFFALYCSAAVAQVSDYDHYMKSVDENALLFRGKIDNKTFFKCKGTSFAYQNEFTLGEVFFNEKLYKNVLINLNSQSDELYVKKDSEKLSIILEKDLVDYFNLEGRKFINLKGKVNGISPGFYEVVYEDSAMLLKKIKKIYREELEAGVNDAASIVKSYDPEIRYFLYKDSAYYPIKGKTTFTSHYKEKKKEINKIFSHASVAEKRDKDLLYRHVMEEVCTK